MSEHFQPPEPSKPFPWRRVRPYLIGAAAVLIAHAWVGEAQERDQRRVLAGRAYYSADSALACADSVLVAVRRADLDLKAAASMSAAEPSRADSQWLSWRHWRDSVLQRREFLADYHARFSCDAYQTGRAHVGSY